MRKRIALVAHDSCKREMVDWVEANKSILALHEIIATGTTGRLVEEALNNDVPESEKVCVRKLKSGPLGGDQQLGAFIADGTIDMVVFFWDPMTQQPHDVDVKALLRITVLYNVPMACNRTTADYLISSPLFADENYQRKEKSYDNYINRKIE
ncbi:MAG: methylglyoxal synthase [Bacteroidales bacterium]|nr:methylglyoxal synthase [Bacteroidales bacterium]